MYISLFLRFRRFFPNRKNIKSHRSPNYKLCFNFTSSQLSEKLVRFLKLQGMLIRILGGYSLLAFNQKYTVLWLNINESQIVIHARDNSHAC